mgnify:FL=1|jgi:hypothetical protein|tara:strand:+ start:178 stop:378 length:201 start_codon:yes stop_codon:yes gene_type:complete
MRFLFFLFIIWWVIFMIILPIKRKNFVMGIPGKSYLLVKAIFSLLGSLIISLILIDNEAFLFNLIK